MWHENLVRAASRSIGSMLVINRSIRAFQARLLTIPRSAPCSAPRGAPRRLCSGGQAFSTPPTGPATYYNSSVKMWLESTQFKYIQSTTVYKFFNNIIVVRIFRVWRMMLLCYGVYYCGQKDGMVKYALDEKNMQKNLRNSLVENMGGSKIMTQQDRNYYKHHDRALKISKRLINAAHNEYEKTLTTKKEELAKAKLLQEQAFKNYQRLKEERSKQIATNESLEREYREAEIERISRNTEKMDLDEEIKVLAILIDKMFNGHHWSVFVTDSVIPNAFVSNICPRTIFIHVGLIERASDDELAVVVGHELAHLLLYHTDDRDWWSFTLKTFTLILMSQFDPSGIATNALEWVIMKVGNFVERRIGHNQENEADELGVILAHAACYNVRKGRMFLNKMERWNQDALLLLNREEGARESGAAAVYDSGWNSTHPSHEFREEHVSAIINKLATNSHCGTVKFQLQRASEYLQRMQHHD